MAATEVGYAPDEASVTSYGDIADAFDALASTKATRRLRGYDDLLKALHAAIVPREKTVLEIGSGRGDLLAGLAPSHGVGVDVSGSMVELARALHPDLRFERGAGENVELGATFDYIILSDLLPYVDDLIALFRNVERHSYPDTRVVIHSYSQLWRPVFRVLEVLNLKQVTPIRNWVSMQDVVNLLALSGLEPVTTSRRIILPLRIPFVSTFFNAFLANLPLVRHLSLTYWVVARPRPSAARRDLSLSVVVPVKNEAGTIERIVAETQPLGSQDELIFVEGHSTDGTADKILEQITHHPERRITYVEQTGHGKGDAVRLGFSSARGDVLVILDGDLTVRASDLPHFLDAIQTGRADFVNGSRLVYSLEPGAMQLLNLIANKAFSSVFSALLGQPIKDTLCGTKALERRRYEQIAAGRSYFGDFDPFGDFDLLLGAARLNLKILDLPVRYGARAYGQTKISRFRHGWLLLRMTVFAFRKLRVDILDMPRDSSR